MNPRPVRTPDDLIEVWRGCVGYPKPAPEPIFDVDELNAEQTITRHHDYEYDQEAEADEIANQELCERNAERAICP